MIVRLQFGHRHGHSGWSVGQIFMAGLALAMGVYFFVKLWEWLLS
jgi:hypothetical protein